MIFDIIKSIIIKKEKYMYKIVEVNNHNLLKKFVNFPVTLYEENPYYVPELTGEEMKNLNPKKSVYLKTNLNQCKCFLCLKDDVVVARACGIISNVHNEKTNSKRIRLSRFDTIEDFEAAKMVIEAVENWGKSMGMDTIHGPLDFNDLGREGMLVEGFDHLSTFETQYNLPYYSQFLEKLGYQKEVDWLECLIPVPHEPDKRNERLAEIVKKRSKLHEVEIKSVNWLIKNYYDEIFDLIDETYGTLYGTIPFTPEIRKSLVSQFKLILDKDFVCLIADENGKLAGFGFALPNIARAVQRSKGRLFPLGWARILHSLNNVEVVDMALIGVLPQYQDTGATSIIFNSILKNMCKRKIKVAETNVQLEENFKSIKLFDPYNPKHKCRRRSYVKSLDGKEIKFHNAMTNTTT